MNRLLWSVFVALVATNAVAKDLVIALSPYDTQSRVEAVLQVLAEMEAEDRVWLVDGYHLRQLGQLSVPEGTAYAHPKARLGANRSTMGQLVQFSKALKPVGQPGQPSIAQAVRLPQLLQYVAQTWSEQPVDVWVLGSPMYDDPNEPAFSMSGERFPGDGHLTVSQGRSPFGLVGQSLSNQRLHLSYDEPLNDRYGYYVRRFWSLWIAEQGGVLASFSGDIQSVWQRIQTDAPAMTTSYERHSTDKLELIQLPKVQIRQALFDRPVSTRPLSNVQIQRGDQVEIGIAWDCVECDLDLYARPHPGAQTLFYGHPQSPEGRLWKDYQQSPLTANGFETIAFSRPIDLRALFVAINFYAGEAPNGVTGEVRVSVNGRTYSAPFKLTATAGQGSGPMEQILARGRSALSHVRVVDILRLVRSS